jgi:DNA-binding NarL/FixJ family response regulator
MIREADGKEMDRTATIDTLDPVSTFINLRAQLRDSLTAMKLQRDELHQRTGELRVGRELLHRTASLIYEGIANRHVKENGIPATPAREVAFIMPTLTSRQRSVLEGILAGQANKAIAFDLGVSTKTVETHRARVMQRFGATSFAELVRLCCRATRRLEAHARDRLGLAGTQSGPR